MQVVSTVFLFIYLFIFYFNCPLSAGVHMGDWQLSAPNQTVALTQNKNERKGNLAS